MLCILENGALQKDAYLYIDVCRGLFYVWCIGLPPAVMGWAASCGDGPKYF